MENIFSFTKNDLIKKFESDGKKKFMASQVFDWLYDKKVYNFDEFTNIKKENILIVRITLNLTLKILNI